MPDAASHSVAFAHPSEEEIARLLDFYHVSWEYEPRSFALEWDAQGRSTRSFTPDFYLPEYDMFLEVTTVKPSLAHRKHRKIRQLRELYPDVMIKLFSLRDMEALMMKYGVARAEGSVVKTQKDLSDAQATADRPENPPTTSVPHAVPTDLPTHRDRLETDDA